jgi:hypothetical protein
MPTAPSRDLTVSEAEHPIRNSTSHEVTVDDVRQLMGASTPHFALQIRNRIARLIRGLPADHPARQEGEREIARLTRLGYSGESRGLEAEEGLPPLPSLNVEPAPAASRDVPH